MIHSARPYRPAVVNIVFHWNLFCFETWGRTYGQHVRKQWSLSTVTVGRPRGSIYTILVYEEICSMSCHDLWYLILLEYFLYFNNNIYLFLIHSANPKSRPVGIIVFAHVVRTSVTHFSEIFQNKRRLKIMIATGRDCWSGRGDYWSHMSCWKLVLTEMRRHHDSHTTVPRNWQWSWQEDPFIQLFIQHPKCREMITINISTTFYWKSNVNVKFNLR